MRHGLVNAGEPYAQKLLEVIVEKLVGKPRSKGELLCFSVPGPPQGAPSSLVYHEALMKQMLDNMGFEAKSINEGLAVVFSELEKENFSGIGISFGGGLTNVCLAYLSVPVFSVRSGQRGRRRRRSRRRGHGRDRDPREGHQRRRARLERTSPQEQDRRRASNLLQDLIANVVDGIAEALSRADRMPKLDKPLPVVLGGGSALPKGFATRFHESARGEEKLASSSSRRYGWRKTH